LGGLQELYPSLPKPNLEELAVKRTIGQVVEYLQSHASRSVSVEIAIHEVQQAAEIAPVVTPSEPVVDQVFTPVSAPVSEIVAFSTEPETANVNDYADLGQNLLNITSEKTGYPVEMLEMEMDMEADLGIDSIKRVEILGAMQEMYPNLPKPNIEELGDLRTIGQIVDYLQQLAGGEKKKSQFEFDDKPIEVEAEPEEEEEEDVDHNVQRRPAKLKFLPSPDHLDFSLPEGHISLITDDGSLTTSVVAQSLIDKGWKVVVLSFPQSLIPHQATLPAGAERITLADLSEELLQHKLTAIATNIGTIGAFIHIHPVFQLTNSERIPYLEQEKAIVKHIFFIAKHLKKSLNEAAHYGRSCFCTVTRLDGAFGFEHKTNYGVIGAGLFGLTKTLRWEWPKVYCRAIDLNPSLDAQQSAKHIIAELHDSNLYISEVAYGSQGRVTLTSSVE
jgi:acyl carrier protein